MTTGHSPRPGDKQRQPGTSLEMTSLVARQQVCCSVGSPQITFLKSEICEENCNECKYIKVQALVWGVGRAFGTESLWGRDYGTSAAEHAHHGSGFPESSGEAGGHRAPRCRSKSRRR